MTTYADMAWDEETEICVILTHDQARALLNAYTIEEFPLAFGKAGDEHLRSAEAVLRDELGERTDG